MHRDAHFALLSDQLLGCPLWMVAGDSLTVATHKKWRQIQTLTSWTGRATLQSCVITSQGCRGEIRAGYLDAWRHSLPRGQIHHVTNGQQLTCLSATLLWRHRLCFDWQSDVAVVRHSFDLLQQLSLSLGFCCLGWRHASNWENKDMSRLHESVTSQAWQAVLESL